MQEMSKVFGMLGSASTHITEVWCDVFLWLKQRKASSPERNWVCGPGVAVVWGRFCQNETCIDNLILFYYFYFFPTLFRSRKCPLSPWSASKWPCRVEILNIEETCYNSML